MTRRIPILATLLVMAAVATMIALGFWQLERRDQKREMLESFRAAQKSDIVVPWPGEGESESSLYRRSQVTCVRVVSHSGIAGRNAKGDAGVAQVADCVFADGETGRVVLGWSRQPLAVQGVQWQGGEVRGVIAPGPRLVADPPLAGLEANAMPDPSQIPDNHLSYAVQWFLFAGAALVVYVLALRKRLQEKPAPA